MWSGSRDHEEWLDLSPILNVDIKDIADHLNKRCEKIFKGSQGFYVLAIIKMKLALAKMGRTTRETDLRGWPFIFEHIKFEMSIGHPKGRCHVDNQKYKTGFYQQSFVNISPFF